MLYNLLSLRVLILYCFAQSSFSSTVVLLSYTHFDQLLKFTYTASMLYISTNLIPSYGKPVNMKHQCLIPPCMDQNASYTFMFLTKQNCTSSHIECILWFHIDRVYLFQYLARYQTMSLYSTKFDGTVIPFSVTDDKCPQLVSQQYLYILYSTLPCI